MAHKLLDGARCSGPSLKASVDIVLIPSVEEMVEMFWDMDNHQQAEFFNLLNLKPSLPFQLQAVSDCERLNSSGRSAMAKIGEYAEPIDNKETQG